jgi:hypothetical protein
MRTSHQECQGVSETQVTEMVFISLLKCELNVTVIWLWLCLGSLFCF